MKPETFLAEVRIQNLVTSLTNEFQSPPSLYNWKINFPTRFPLTKVIPLSTPGLLFLSHLDASDIIKWPIKTKSKAKDPKNRKKDLKIQFNETCHSSIWEIASMEVTLEKHNLLLKDKLLRLIQVIFTVFTETSKYLGLNSNKILDIHETKQYFLAHSSPWLQKAPLAISLDSKYLWF